MTVRCQITACHVKFILRKGFTAAYCCTKPAQPAYRVVLLAVVAAGLSNV